MANVSDKPEDPAKPSVLELLASLNLEEIRASIAEKQQALDALVKERQGEIAALRLFEKAADLKQNGQPPKSPRKAKATSKKMSDGQAATSQNQSHNPNLTPANENPNRTKIFDYLALAGPSTPHAIAAGIEFPVGPCVRLLGHSWFQRNPDGTYEIAKRKSGF